MGNPKVNRSVVWSRAKRADLMRILKPVCKRCGATACLTFDCIVPKGGYHHKLSSVARMTFYVRQFRAGNLQVLCHDCNSRKRDLPMARYVTSVRPTDFSDEFLDFV